MPSADLRKSGRTPPRSAPHAVPAAQKIYGSVISPYIYALETFPSRPEATANTSSVMPNAVVTRWNSP